MTKIFGILDTTTDTFVSYNSKCGWSKEGNAKNAFNLHTGAGRTWAGVLQPYYDEQTRYKIVNLTEIYFNYKDLCK